MNTRYLLEICHSIDNFYQKFERLFLDCEVSKKDFVAPKPIHEAKVLCGLMAKVEKKS